MKWVKGTIDGKPFLNVVMEAEAIAIGFNDSNRWSGLYTSGISDCAAIFARTEPNELVVMHCVATVNLEPDDYPSLRERLAKSTKIALVYGTKWSANSPDRSAVLAAQLVERAGRQADETRYGYVSAAMGPSGTVFLNPDFRES